MNSILKNIIRLGLVSIYPLILLLCAFLIWRKAVYRKAIKENIKEIIINTLIPIIVLSLIILIFFKFEDTIYSYDYAGHWIRSLRLRSLFFDNPYAVLPTVYESMVNQDYSSLPALFNLGPIVVNTSYGFFVLSTMYAFFVPSIIVLQIIYFSLFSNKKYLPTIVILSFYPLYITLFNGEIDLVGVFFVLMVFALIIIPKFEDIDNIDNLTLNFFGFLMIFLRRWYLYSLVGLYLAYFLKYLNYYNFKPFSKKGLKDFIKIVFSGLILLFVVLFMFKPFFLRVIGNNYNETYEYYNRDHKMYYLLNFYSPAIILICIYGIYNIWKKYDKKLFLSYFITMVVIPTLMFWNIQSFEYHHYNIINAQIILLYLIGMYELINTNKKTISITITSFLLIQTSIVFTYCPKEIPFFTKVRKTPEVMENKQEIVDFTYYLKSIMSEDWQSAYLSSSSSLFNDDMLRNSILPDIHAPNIDTAIFDLRDGFPKDLEYVQFVITIDPIQYSDKQYQHMFDIITNALWHEPKIKKLYNPIHSTQIGAMKLTVYERIGEWTDETKRYFYDEMIKYYPDKTDYFAYILD